MLFKFKKIKAKKQKQRIKKNMASNESDVMSYYYTQQLCHNNLDSDRALSGGAHCRMLKLIL